MNQKSNHSNKTDTISKSEIIKIEDSKVSKVQKENEIIAALRKKRIESMTDEEIIEENLKAILDKKNQEERKANGRLIAVLVAFLVIFLAIYHAWIRKTAVLAGVLVPAAIMLGYGGWVVVLAKRDKKKREMFEKHIEEVSLKNKAELEKKSELKNTKSNEEKPSSTSATKTKTKKPKTKTTLHYENETLNKNNKSSRSGNPIAVQMKDHRTKSKRQNKPTILVTEDGRRPSLTQKLFGQTPKDGLNVKTKNNTDRILVHEKRKKLERMETLPLPQVVRMSSAP